MSILEEFLVLFKADTSDLKAGSKDAQRLSDELNNKLKITDDLSRKAATSFQNFAKQATGALLALVGTAAIIGTLKSAVTYADMIGKASDAIGVSTEALSAWGDAVKLNGGTAEGFISTVKVMTAALADFATKGTSRAAPFFKELGVQMVDSRGKARNFLDVLPEIATAFEKLSKAESFGIGRKMGLDEGTIILLQKGRREVDAFLLKQKELGVVTKQDTEIAAKFNDAWANTVHAFRSFAVQVNSTVLPFLTSILDLVTDITVFLRKNPEILKAIAVAVAGVFIAVFPIAAAVLAIGAAFVLIADDIKNFMAGNNSLIGELEKRWPTAFKIATQALQLWWHYFSSIWKSIGMVLDFALGNLNAFDSAIPGLGAAFSNVGEVILAVWQLIQQAIQDTIGIFSGAIDTVSNGFSKIKYALGIGGNAEISAGVTATQGALGFASTSPINSLTSNSFTNANRSAARSTNVNVGDVTINTQATNPEGIASAFNQSLVTQMRQAIDTFDDGVLA